MRRRRYSIVRRRGSSLALFAFAGTLTGFLGPVVVGVALDWSGGLGSKAGWTAAFLVMALGSTAAAIVIWRQLRHMRQTLVPLSEFLFISAYGGASFAFVIRGISA